MSAYPKERIVRAIFSDGQSVDRGSISKVYTHAYRFVYRYLPTNGVSNEVGFSSSLDQAERNMRAQSAWARNHPETYQILSSEVVPVDLIEKRGRQ